MEEETTARLRVMVVAGARPNFVKVAPLVAQLAKARSIFDQVLVHTGQHYDDAMSDAFLRDLRIPKPTFSLGVGSSTHATQIANVMLRLEPVIREWKPQWVVVVGDVNSTLAAALTAAKLGVPVAHVEAGLRSYDRTMPEECNRVVTDHICDLLLTPSEDASENLRREGIPDAHVRFVGNVMIDTLVRLVPLAKRRPTLRNLGLLSGIGRPRQYVLVTMHRPSNVDDPAHLRALIDALQRIAQDRPVVFPVHPRTRRRLDCHGSLDGALTLTEPLGYLDFVALERNASVVITDSGGVQEETTYLGVPCVTVRENTERPVTVLQGTNRIVGTDPDALVSAVEGVLAGRWRRPTSPPRLWDGRASERIVRAIAEASGFGPAYTGRLDQGGGIGEPGAG